MKELLKRLSSRKFLLAVLGILTAFFQDKLHLDNSQIAAIVALIVAFTAAEGTVDAIRANAQQESTPQS